MPLTFSFAERATLAGETVVHYTRVLVEGPDGAMVDMNSTDLGGFDWFVRARWRKSIDTPTMSGSVTFAREHLAMSLSPYVAASTLNSTNSLFQPFIAGGRLISIEVATMPLGVAPDIPDFRQVFAGVLANPSFGGRDAGEVTCAMADLGSLLMQQTTQDDADFSDDVAGLPLETVMQAVLDANPNSKLGTVVLYTPASPGVNRRKITVPRGKPILLALRELAESIGWTVRYAYDAAGQFRLTFYEPDRTKTIADYSLTPDEFQDITDFEIPTDDVRNILEIGFVDRTTGIPGVYRYENQASIDQYGERYARSQEGTDSPVDSLAEATLMGDAMGADLSIPYARQRVHVPVFFWPADLGDLIDFAPPGLIYDSSQKQAIVEAEFALEKEAGWVELLTSEQVLGAYRIWQRKISDAPPPVAPTIAYRVIQGSPAITADVELTPTTQTPELLGVFVQVEGGATWTLVVSGVDATPLGVQPGTVIDPTTAWFYDASGPTFAHLLDDVALDPNIPTRMYAQAVGLTSKLMSAWIPIVLSAQNMPAIQAAQIAFFESDPLVPASAQLNFSVTSGKLVASIKIEINTADVWTGGPYLTTLYYNLAPNTTLSDLFASITLVRQAAYFMRVTPYSGPLVAGLPSGTPGASVIASTFAPFRAASQAQVDVVEADTATNTTAIAAQNAAQVLVSAVPAGGVFPGARQVADSPTVAFDFGVAGAAQAYVPLLGIGTPQLGSLAVTTAKVADGNVTPAKLAAGATTPGAATTYRGDGTWQNEFGTIQFPFGNGTTMGAAGDWLVAAPDYPWDIVGWSLQALDVNGDDVAIDAAFTVKKNPWGAGAQSTLVAAGVNSPRLVTQAENSGGVAGWTATSGVAKERIRAILASITPGTATSLLLTITVKKV